MTESKHREYQTPYTERQLDEIHYRLADAGLVDEPILKPRPHTPRQIDEMNYVRSNVISGKADPTKDRLLPLTPSQLKEMEYTRSIEANLRKVGSKLLAREKEAEFIPDGEPDYQELRRIAGLSKRREKDLPITVEL